MYLASQLHVVAMDDCIGYRFRYGTFGIVRQFFAVVTFFPPFLP